MNFYQDHLYVNFDGSLRTNSCSNSESLDHMPAAFLPSGNLGPVERAPLLQRQISEPNGRNVITNNKSFGRQISDPNPCPGHPATAKTLVESTSSDHSNEQDFTRGASVSHSVRSTGINASETTSLISKR